MNGAEATGTCPQIMVVEDESITAKDIENRLIRLGYRVSGIARSGEEAIEKAARTHPDLVLMDIKLKGLMDGVEAAGQLRSRFGIPVAYLTAFADEETLARAEATAPYGYLVKPFEERELHATIQMALRRCRLEKQVEESERWLAAILDAVGDAIIATDAHGFVRLMNRVAESLTGWTRSSALGNDLARVFCTAPLSGEGPGAGGRPSGATEEVLLLPKGGRIVPIEVCASTARDQSEQIKGFVWVFREIAARKRAEQALREKEDYFRSLIEQSSDIISVVDEDGTVYYASPSFERMLGYNPADLLGKSLIDILHPSDTSNAATSLARAMTAAEPISLEGRARHQDGSWRILEVVGRRLTSAGQPRLVINARDVTERKLAESQLREELDVSAALGRVSREMIAGLGTHAVLDRLCQVTAQALQCEFSHTWLWSPEEQAYTTVAGYGDSPEQWESMRALKVPGSVVARLVAQLNRDDVVAILMDEGPSELLPVALPKRWGITAALYVALRRAGEMVAVQTVGYRRSGANFTPQQLRVAREIGQLASVALENGRLVEELEESNRLKDDLMAILSHELRAPLSAIVGLIDLLIKEEFGRLTPEQNEHLSTIDQRLRQVRDLVNTTLDFARVQRRSLPIDLVELRASDLIAEVRAEAAALSSRPGVELCWEIDPELPEIRSDPSKLKIAIKNLLSNALKYTEKGTVTVRVHPSGDGLECCVMDTGIGIAPEAREAVFEPFRQLDAKPGQVREGIGLGLYITRRLLEMLKGRITLESAPGVGSTFRIWVPRDSGTPGPSP